MVRDPLQMLKTLWEELPQVLPGFKCSLIFCKVFPFTKTLKPVSTAGILHMSLHASTLKIQTVGDFKTSHDGGFLHPGAFHKMMFVGVSWCLLYIHHLPLHTSSYMFRIYIYFLYMYYIHVFRRFKACFSMQPSIISVHSAPPWDWECSPHVCVEFVESFVVNFPCCFLPLPKDAEGE